MTIQILTAETAAGRDAITEVMARSYQTDVDSFPPEWAMARVVDGVPVSFILIEPDHIMQFPKGNLHYAFICDVATRDDRRREGHFHALMEFTFERLRAAGIPLVVTHGRCQLYRRFDFTVFTHHCGLMITPEQITRHLGAGEVEEAASYLEIETRGIVDDLLLVTGVQVGPDAAESVGDSADAILALQAAAALAQEHHKSRILFEYPPAPSYGSRYPTYAALENPLAALVCTCGGQRCIQGADPESGRIPDADWIKILDLTAFLQKTILCLEIPLDLSLCVTFETDAGEATLICAPGTLAVVPGPVGGAVPVRWPASALAQLATGYQSAAALDARYGSELDPDTLNALHGLFPPTWRLSRNESWVYEK
ncbi:MAG: GNAT family N-acetyltransferase [Anaerolineae bacterium]|nr:GNAT family N-acetyltransferase [Anaerolineae bacterium]